MTSWPHVQINEQGHALHLWWVESPGRMASSEQWICIRHSLYPLSKPLFCANLCRTKEITASLNGLDYLLMFFRVEKESLETSLFEAQELAAQLEARKEQLEGENEGIDLARQSLQGTVYTVKHLIHNVGKLSFCTELWQFIRRESSIQTLTQSIKIPKKNKWQSQSVFILKNLTSVCLVACNQMTIS